MIITSASIGSLPVLWHTFAVVAEQPMYGVGRAPDDFLQALRGLAGRRRQLTPAQIQLAMAAIVETV